MYATRVEFYTPTQCVGSKMDGSKMGGVQDGYHSKDVPLGVCLVVAARQRGTGLRGGRAQLV